MLVLPCPLSLLRNSSFVKKVGDFGDIAEGFFHNCEPHLGVNESLSYLLSFHSRWAAPFAFDARLQVRLALEGRT